MELSAPTGNAPIVCLLFHGDLLDFFQEKAGAAAHLVRYRLLRRASIKDIIEALGIPHTEIGKIARAGQELNFSFLPQGGEVLDIEPQSPHCPVTKASTLRPQPLERISFLVDTNVGKLARLLRMVGIDAAAPAHSSNIGTAACAVREQRILLSRNKELLKLRMVTFGRLIRNQDPIRQFEETNRLFNLAPLFQPFSRCMACNGILNQVDKAAIDAYLEPLTRRYYHHFKQCGSCNRVYWRGSHHQRMTRAFGLSNRPA